MRTKARVKGMVGDLTRMIFLEMIGINADHVIKGPMELVFRATRHLGYVEIITSTMATRRNTG